MVTGRITNLVLDKNRFIVFVEFSNGINETQTFMPEITAADIRQWVADREIYYNMLIDKEIELKNELI